MGEMGGGCFCEGGVVSELCSPFEEGRYPSVEKKSFFILGAMLALAEGMLFQENPRMGHTNVAMAPAKPVVDSL